jgi:uncharacterized membrane protein
MCEFIFRPFVRTIIAAALAVVCYLVTAGFLHPYSRLLLAWNLGVGALLLILATMMVRSDAKQTSVRSQKEEPSELASVATVVVTSLASYIGTASMLDSLHGKTGAAQTLHLTLSIVTVFTAWLLVHTYFALYYAQVYYDETADMKTQPFKGGLEFPDGEYADYWDFMYYSFTIGMCYQTSDVTITSKVMRRMSLAHAVVSFFFVAGILGLMVNILSAIV